MSKSTSPPMRPSRATSLIPRAIEVFARGFGFTRSLTHPYQVERVGPLWLLRDAPRRNGDYRNEEWIAHGVEPAEVDRIAREHTRGRYAVCAIHATGEPDQPLRAGFKALGYRLNHTEPFMVHRLAKIPPFESPAVVERVRTQEMADRLAKAARSRQVLPEHLVEENLQTAPLRQYVASIDGQIVGWVRSILVGDAAWCSNMHVLQKFRRRGIGRAMLSQLLRDHKAGGGKSSVLLASHTGALLYAAVGYEQIGTLLLFTPRRR